jgi:hypothetical protein
MPRATTRKIINNGIAGAENWARFHAGTPGCDRLEVVLDEYDRRGAEARRYREALQALLDLQERLENDVVTNEDYDQVLDRVRGVLDEEAGR